MHLVVTRYDCQLINEGNPVAASEAFERAWKGYQKLYGDQSKMTLDIFGKMAMAHPSIEEGERLLQTAVQQSSDIYGPGVSKTMLLENNLLWTKLF